MRSPDPAVRITSAAGVLILMPKASSLRARPDVSEPVGAKGEPESRPRRQKLHTSGAKD